MTTSFVFVGGSPSTNDHCAAYGLLSQAAPKVGANPFEINTVSPSTIFMNWANPNTSPQAAFTLGKFEISSILSSGIFLTSNEIGP